MVRSMAEILLHFHPDVRLKCCSKACVTFMTPAGELVWKNPSSCLFKSLKALLETGEVESALAAHWKKEGQSLFQFYYFLENLKRQGLLSYGLKEQKPIATLIPAILGDVGFKEVSFKEPLQWAEAATLRLVGTQWVLARAGACSQVILHEPLFLSVIWKLAQRKTFAALQKEIKTISRETLTQFLSLLASASLLEQEDLSHEKLHALSECIKYAHKLCYQQVGKT